MYIPDNRGSVYKSGTHVDSWCIAFDAYDDCPTTAYFLNITYQQLFKGISKAETVTFSWLGALCKHFIGCPRCQRSVFFQWNVEICVCKLVRPSPRGHLTHSLISGHEFHSLVLTRSTLQHRKALLPQSKSSWLFYAAWGCEFWIVFQHTWRVLEFYFYNVDINS